MDFTLIPVCSEREHIMNNKYKKLEYYCSICDREGIDHQCINCEYTRCATCHKGVIRQIRDEQFERAILISMHDKINKALLKEQRRLNRDGLIQWTVKLSRKDKELYYYNDYTKSISFDYPLFRIPNISPVNEGEEELSITGYAVKIFQNMKTKVSNLNIY